MFTKDVVFNDVHERMISVKLGVRQIEEACEKGDFAEVIVLADKMRGLLEFSGFERQVFESVSKE